MYNYKLKCLDNLGRSFRWVFVTFNMMCTPSARDSLFLLCVKRKNEWMCDVLWRRVLKMPRSIFKTWLIEVM